MVRSLSKRGMPKPFAILIAALLALYFVPFVATPASAAVVGGFEIEGNLVDDTPADPPIDNSGQDTTTFKGASKEYNLQSEAGGWPNWEFGTGNATGKSDFGRWATYDFVDNQNHVWFFFGFDRGFGTGTAKYAFELNQITQSPTTDANPDRSQGDLRMIIWDQGNGVVTLTPDAQNEDVGLYVWDDPDVPGLGAGPLDSDQDGVWVKSNQSGVFAGASNTGETPVSVPSWWTGGNVVNGTLTKDTFLEFGIDLTSFGAVLGCPSAGFSAVNARSITGTGGPGTLVDYLAAIPVTIPSNCASLVINKEDADGNPLGGATFEIDPNPLPDGTPGSNLDTLVIFDDSDSNTTVEAGTNYDDPDATAGRITLAAVVPGVEYTITEVSPPLGYIGDPDSQSVTPVPFSEDNEVTFVNTLGSAAWEKRDADSNELICCATFNVLGTGGAAETLGIDIDVTDNSAPDADPDAGQIKLVGLPTGTYEVTETAAPDGYQLPDNAVRTFSITAENPDVVIEQDFLDELVPGGLIIKKVLNGPIAGASTDFVVALDCAGTEFDDPSIELNAGNSFTDGPRSIPAGTECSVTETSVPAGWTLESISPLGTFTVETGSTVTVTVTNKRNTGAITVTKNIVGAPNGASTSFTFDVDCPGTDFDQSVTINLGSGTSGSASTGQIPTGLTCTVTERSTPNWQVTSVVPAGGVVTVPGNVTFTNTRLQGALNISKAVSPVAGGGVVVEFGDTLTYTLTVSATGNITQNNVIVTDYVPGFDPARPTSGKTTYVAGSATCIGAGTCNVTQPGANGLITWGLGDMAAGTTRQVTFKVTIDDVKGEPGETVAVDILNAGAVQSTQTPKKPSNQVITPVTKVLPVKVVQPKQLPRTGATLPIGQTVGSAITLLVIGLLLATVGRRRTGAHRR